MNSSNCKPLPIWIKLNAEYLEKHRQKAQFRQFVCTRDFYLESDPRALSLRAGETVSAFSQEDDWVCAFKDQGSGQFGFVPLSYLRFERQTRSGTPTRACSQEINQYMQQMGLNRNL